MAGVAYNRKVTGFLACLLGLGVLFYFGTIDGFKPRHPAVHDEGVDVASVNRPVSAGRVESADVLPVKNDTSSPDDVDTHPVDVDRTTTRARVSIDEPLDLDADPVMFYTARLTGQKNTGVFLDADGEPDDLNSSEDLPVQNTGLFLDIDAEPDKQSSSEITAPRNVGVFLDLDDNGSDSHIDAGNELVEVNTGKFLDLDGL